MQQSTRPEVQPLSGPENEKGIKKEEADSTTLGSVPASASAPALASGGQQTLAPQVESLARALVVPYHRNQNQNQRAADLADSSRNYVPLAVAMASGSNVNQTQGQHQHQYAYPAQAQGQGHNQGMAIGSAVSGYNAGPFASMTNPGAVYPFGSTSAQGWGSGSAMTTGYGNGFGPPYAPAANMWPRPMGRAFTMTPTPEPQGYTGLGGFSAGGQGAFGFAHQRHPSLATSPPASSPGYAYPSGTSVSGGYALQSREPTVKDEHEDSRIALEAQVQRLHLSPSFATPERSTSARASERAQSHPVVSTRVSGACPSLGSLEMKSLPPKLVLFYFGVLTTQASLMPRFDFTREDSGRWGVKLTLYGHTLVKEEYGSQTAAKLAACRDAMEALRLQYPGWAVPDEPHETETESLWNWTRLLSKYCEQNKLPSPKYTKYVHVKGYRYEVEVDGVSYFGVPKSHRTEREATNAAAHMGMHSTLVRCLQDDVGLLGGELSLDVNPRLGTASSLVAAHRTAAKDKGPKVLKMIMPKGKAAPKVGKKKKEKKINSNLLPVVNRRIRELTPPSNPTKSSRWNVTPSQIKSHIGRLGTGRERLEKTCNLLDLQYPEIEISQTDGRLVDNSEGEYRAAAFFPNDPFLARVGPIGTVKQILKDKTEAREVCSRKVVDYLIKMVEEDTALDNEVAKEKEKVERWKENAIIQYVHQGFVDVEEGEVLMKDA